MPSAFSHAVVPLAVGLGLGRNRVSRRLMVAGMVCAAAPDLDVLAFRWGIPYESQWGHRGFTHSLGFSLACGALAVLLRRVLHSDSATAFCFITGATLSHALLDAATNGGLGVALWWPLLTERVFWSFRPIEVSPIGIGRFFSGRGLAVLRSEFTWVWLPALACGGLLYAARVFRKSESENRDQER